MIYSVYLIVLPLTSAKSLISDLIVGSMNLETPSIILQ